MLNLSASVHSNLKTEPTKCIDKDSSLVLAVRFPYLVSEKGVEVLASGWKLEKVGIRYYFTNKLMSSLLSLSQGNLMKNKV